MVRGGLALTLLELKLSKGQLVLQLDDGPDTLRGRHECLMLQRARGQLGL